MKRIIPKNKIKGERFGQLLWNAMVHFYKDFPIPEENLQLYICDDKIFFMENDELEKLLQAELKRYRKSLKSKSGKL